VVDGPTILSQVQRETTEELDRKDAQRATKGKAPRTNQQRQTVYAAIFAKHFGKAIREALEPEFPGMKSGETPSQAVLGVKRVDVNYSTPEAGLGFAVSLKSVHFGEQGDDSHFTHNIKRNDEELRVEATAHHLRQPYAVLVAVVVLPFTSCTDRPGDTSSFAAWVEHLWALKGRVEPDDPPDRFELVFVALYARNGSELLFFEVGGEPPASCPKKGRPTQLLTFEQFLRRIKRTYYKRNGRDFAFEGDEPPG
jgi:hypothetical protein